MTVRNVRPISPPPKWSLMSAGFSYNHGLNKEMGLQYSLTVPLVWLETLVNELLITFSSWQQDKSACLHERCSTITHLQNTVQSSSTPNPPGLKNQQRLKFNIANFTKRCRLSEGCCVALHQAGQVVMMLCPPPTSSTWCFANNCYLVKSLSLGRMWSLCRQHCHNNGPWLAQKKKQLVLFKWGKPAEWRNYTVSSKCCETGFSMHVSSCLCFLTAQWRILKRNNPFTCTTWR